MRLDDILQGNEALIFMERYVDEAAKTYSPFAGQSEVAPEYRPRSDRPSFELVTVCAPRDRVTVFQADPTETLRQHYVRTEFYRPFDCIVGVSRFPDDFQVGFGG